MNTNGVCRFDMMISTGISVIVALSLFVSGCAIQPPHKHEDTADRVEDTADRVINVDVNIQQIFSRAVVLLQQEDYAGAIKLLDQVVASEQRLTAPYINLAIAYDRSDDRVKAQENLDKALTIDKYDPVANNERGLLYRKQGKFEEARAAYLTALEKYPDDPPVNRNLGILCDLYLRDWKCALDQYEKYLQLAPEDEKVKIWIADLKNRAGS